MTDLKRGFKTYAETLAAEERAELGLGPLDALHPWTLAEHHGIEVLVLSSLDKSGIPAASAAIDHFTGPAQSALSALLLPLGFGVAIIENDAHAPTRRTSNLAHELGHVLLEHEFGHALFADGCRDMDPSVEGEALWLSGSLLIPRQGALLSVRDGMADDDVADRYGVSRAFARMRLNTSGVRKQVAREHARRSR